MLGAHGLWAGSDFYRATYALTLGIIFPVSSEVPPILSPLTTRKGVLRTILTRNLTGPHSVVGYLYDTQGDAKNLF
jgi:hypothetical protein